MRTETTTEFHAENYDGVESYCISIAFYRPTLSRAGNPTNDLIVNGVPVEAGATLTIGQNVGDLDTTKYSLDFIDIGGDNEAYIIRIIPKDVGQ